MTRPGTDIATAPAHAAAGISRRTLLRTGIALAAGGLTAASLGAGGVAPAFAASEDLTFDELYSKIGVLGMEFSAKVKALAGSRITMRGFMAPPLKAEAKFFVLSSTPLSICPFCSSDADWPSDIVVVYLERKQTFVQYNAAIDVSGTLEYGSWTDPETGFVSLVRLVDSSFSLA